ncbi:MAG: hypothetical protein ACE5KE_14035 [Methanosarcinales archaeon]
MLLIDSDVFLIDNFYTRDLRFEINKEFLEFVQNKETSTTIFNLLEMCGIMSYNYSQSDLKKFFKNFDYAYNIQILYPKTDDFSANDFLMQLLQESFNLILKKVNFSDSLIFVVAKQYSINTFITWNTKHFKHLNKSIKVFTPTEYLENFKK